MIFERDRNFVAVCFIYLSITISIYLSIYLYFYLSLYGTSEGKDLVTNLQI